MKSESVGSVGLGRVKLQEVTQQIGDSKNDRALWCLDPLVRLGTLYDLAICILEEKNNV